MQPTLDKTQTGKSRRGEKTPQTALWVVSEPILPEGKFQQENLREPPLITFVLKKGEREKTSPHLGGRIREQIMECGPCFLAGI